MPGRKLPYTQRRKAQRSDHGPPEDTLGLAVDHECDPSLLVCEPVLSDTNQTSLKARYEHTRVLVHFGNHPPPYRRGPQFHQTGAESTGGNPAATTRRNLTHSLTFF